MKTRHISYFVGSAALVGLLALFGCNQNSDSVQQSQQENILKQATDAVGMPAITRFAERKELKQIYELRDKEIATFTYIVDLNGHRHKLCNSVGFGIPYATQYTNPQKWISTGTTLPQADPNTLFSPSSADGTWVLCLSTETKQISPLYVEPRIIVSPFELADDIK